MPGTWTPLTNQPTFGVGTMLLLQQSCRDMTYVVFPGRVACNKELTAWCHGLGALLGNRLR